MTQVPSDGERLFLHVLHDDPLGVQPLVLRPPAEAAAARGVLS